MFTLPVLAKNTILIIGDSLSAGYGLDDAYQGWVTLLQQRLQQEKYNYHVINASISGDTTSNGLARLPQALKQHQPQITIIELGANDGLRGLQITTIKNNIQSMIDLIKHANSKILLLSIRLPQNYGPDYSEQFAKMYTDLAKQNNIETIQFLHHVDENRHYFQPDGLHPTKEAQQYMLNNVWPVLKKMLVQD